jgi:hypothetical protein
MRDRRPGEEIEIDRDPGPVQLFEEQTEVSRDVNVLGEPLDLLANSLPHAGELVAVAAPGDQSLVLERPDDPVAGRPRDVQPVLQLPAAGQSLVEHSEHGSTAEQLDQELLVVLEAGVAHTVTGVTIA